MHNLIKLLSIIVISALSSSVFAVETAAVYTVEVPVASHTGTAKADAIKIALGQVLVKVSGNSHIMETYPKLKASLDHADDLVQEYSYTATTDPTKTLPFTLLVRFDPEGINKLIQDAGSSLWGQNRPLILVWLAYETPNHSIEIVSSSEKHLQPILNDSAQQRGLPFIFPVMDVTELIQVTGNDVINKSLPVLQSASQRYASNAILMGHVAETAAGINSEWQLVMGKDQWDFNLSGKTVTEVFNALVNQISDTLAKRYAAVVTKTVQANLDVKVTGLKQLTDLSQLMKYLQTLTPVAAVQIKSVNGPETVLTINLRSSKESFTQAVALGTNLQVMPNSNPQDDSLQYQWNP